MVMYLYVRSTRQESDWSFICMLRVQARGVSDHVFVFRNTRQESEWSCICMLGVLARRVSGHAFVC